ncbi:alpha/beta fold hydrolase [Lolliginicoccus levis]|uniref:alpha/beta fold hydrolase n=1 Tax=Lolliginicoccus levis TaxID=2919542 RepID=UPI00241C0513|nr:hypothetical protein [Lolliginicoccus levis]
MKVVFLHGIGDGDPSGGWLEGLNHALVQLRHDPVPENSVIRPHYTDLLTDDEAARKMPPVTYKPKDEHLRRRDFERRQARIDRSFNRNRTVESFGFQKLPDAVLYPAQSFSIDKLSVMDLDQVRRYVRSDALRGAVMNRILDHLPSYGDVILIAHSLGSVIGIDLLDHLPEKLHVRRFITIGSPAHSPALHEGSERLLKKFPYGKVDDWSNFLDTRDVVTGGRGLASSFPGAQDFVIDNGGSHGAFAYLSQPAVAELVADALYPTKDIVLASGDLTARLSDNDISVLLVLHYGRAVRHHIKDKAILERFEAALDIVRDNIIDQIEQTAASTGQPIPAELAELAHGTLPSLPHRWEMHEAVAELIVLAFTNVVDPFEIDTGKAPRDALPEIAVEMGFRRDIGTRVGDAIAEVQRHVDKKSGPPWGRMMTAAAGVAIIAAGPVGLAAAAPAAYGAAALTGGLAAFGPGGMVGGLAMLGGLSGAGAILTTAAITHRSAGGPTIDPQSLLRLVATEYARKLLGLPHDETLWWQLTHAETELSARINRFAAFSDPKAPHLSEMRVKQTIVTRLISFMAEKGLGPRELEAGAGVENGELE